MAGKIKFLLLVSIVLMLLITPYPTLAQGVIPGDFALHSPADGQVFTQWEQQYSWIWEMAENAITYDFKLERIAPDNLVIYDYTGWDGFCDAGFCHNGIQPEDLDLMVDGTYQWNVSARNGDDLTPASNGPRTFILDSTAVLPGGFGLWYPFDDEDFLNAADLVAFFWGQSANVETFTFVLDELSPTPGNLLTLANLTPTADADALNCETDYGGCELTFDAAGQALLADGGEYTWEVTAYTADGYFIAYGSPRPFKIDSTAVLPGPFELWYPWDQQPFNAGTNVERLLWRNATNAVTYGLFIDLPGQHLEWLGLTPAADADALTCDTRRCDYLPDSATQALLAGNVFWYVFAYSADSVAGTAGLSFDINPDAVLPAAFDQINPPTGITYTGATEVMRFDWTESTGATSYLIWFGQWAPLDTGLGGFPDLTPADDEDPLTCVDGRCTLLATTDMQALLAGTEIEWGLAAYNDDGFIPVAGSGDETRLHRFYLSTTAEALLSNGGMETDANTDKIPDDWKLKGTVTGDKRVCNKTEKTVSYVEDCAFMLKGKVNENIKLQQKVNIPAAARAQDYTDLSLSYFVETKNTATGAAIKLLVYYEDTALETDKFVYDLTAGTALYLGTVQTVVPDGAVAKVKVQIVYKNAAATGKVYVDEVRLYGNPTGGALIPLPEAFAPIALPDTPPSGLGSR